MRLTDEELLTLIADAVAEQVSEATERHAEGDSDEDIAHEPSIVAAQERIDMARELLKLRKCADELAATLTAHDAKIEEYRAKLQGEANLDVKMQGHANAPYETEIARLDVMRSKRRLEYFNELFPAAHTPRADSDREE